MRDCVGTLETAVDDAVDHGSPPGCAGMYRDIVIRAHLDALCRTLSGDPPAREKPKAVRFHSVARVLYGRNPHLDVIACGGVGQGLALAVARL